MNIQPPQVLMIIGAIFMALSIYVTDVLTPRLDKK